MQAEYVETLFFQEMGSSTLPTVSYFLSTFSTSPKYLTALSISEFLQVKKQLYSSQETKCTGKTFHEKMARIFFAFITSIRLQLYFFLFVILFSQGYYFAFATVIMRKGKMHIKKCTYIYIHKKKLNLNSFKMCMFPSNTQKLLF